MEFVSLENIIHTARSVWCYLNHSESLHSLEMEPVWPRTSSPAGSGWTKSRSAPQRGRHTLRSLGIGRERIWCYPCQGQTAFCHCRRPLEIHRWREIRRYLNQREKLWTRAVIASPDSGSGGILCHLGVIMSGNFILIHHVKLCVVIRHSDNSC